MGKATSPKKAFLAKLEFSEVCSHFKAWPPLCTRSSLGFGRAFGLRRRASQRGSATRASMSATLTALHCRAKQALRRPPLAEGPHHRNPGSCGGARVLDGRGGWRGRPLLRHARCGTTDLRRIIRIKSQVGYSRRSCSVCVQGKVR